jgi:hypothetical protein
MKVQLTQSIGGTHYSFRAGQVVECSDRVGTGLVEAQVAAAVADETEAEGTIPDVVDPLPHGREYVS